MSRVRRPGLVFLGLAVAALPGVIGPARAFDFFGLFGGQEPPAPSRNTLPYDVTFEVRGDDGVQSALQDSSNLYKLRTDAPPDGETLVARAQSDFAPLIDALWGQGYYDGRVIVEVDGVPLELGLDREGAAARAANRHRARDRVPVKVISETGPLFKLRAIDVIDRRTRAPFPPERLPPRIVKLAPGDPAKAADLRAAQARIVDYFRAQSYPLTKAGDPAATVDHAADILDVRYDVETGPKAGIGLISLTGPQTFPQAVVRSFIYLEPGEPYSPDKLARMRKSIASIPAAGSVRIREAEALDRFGNLPIFVEVTDRAPNLVGFSAGYSTVDGPTGRVFYENRNLFGGAERLRLDAESFLAPRNNGSRIREIEDLRTSDIGGRFKVSFLKPALDGSRADFLFDGQVERNRTGGGRFGGYTVRDGGGTAAIQYRFGETLTASAGFKYERGKVSDVISSVDYQLVGVPLTLKFDNTDKPLDPTQGFRVSANITPYPTFLGSSVALTRASLGASTYYSLDEAGRYILAGRVGLGAFLDDPKTLETIPANYRFYVGGAGSIRGYRYLSVAPRGPFGFVVGGRSSFDASIEARIKVTDNIGVVPFFDIGGAYADQVPNPFKGDTRYAAGLGLTYSTPIGPIRLDVAAPLNPRRGDKEIVLYVSIGQPF